MIGLLVHGLMKRQTLWDSVLKSDILKSGFVPNATKCIWIPVQVFEFLGVVLDALTGTIYIPSHRISKAKQSILDLLSSI